MNKHWRKLCRRLLHATCGEKNVYECDPFTLMQKKYKNWAKRTMSTINRLMNGFEQRRNPSCVHTNLKGKQNCDLLSISFGGWPQNVYLLTVFSLRTQIENKWCVCRSPDPWMVLEEVVKRKPLCVKIRAEILARLHNSLPSNGKIN
jgi:hypothetical protein